MNTVLQMAEQVSGDRTERVTPVPIPNTEVKPLWADGTARATVWETRSLPGLNRSPFRHLAKGAFCFDVRQRPRSSARESYL